MNLQEFVADTLIQVIGGVEQANSELSSSKGKINPKIRGLQSSESHQGTRVQAVDFDIAVSVTEGAETSGHIKVMGIGVGGGSEERNSSVSRIKFSVPVALPGSS